MVFLYFINEVKLVRESRKVFNEHLLIESDKPDSQGVILDTDRTEDQSSADFAKEDQDDYYASGDSGSDMARDILNAKNRAQRGRGGTVSALGGGPRDRPKTPTRMHQ